MPAPEPFAAPLTGTPDEIVDAEVVEEPGAAAAAAQAPSSSSDVALLAEVRPLEAAPAPALPAVQAAAAAATGFVAGAATLVLVRRYGARRLARTQQQQRRVIDGLPIVGSRSFLVDVHLIAKPQE